MNEDMEERVDQVGANKLRKQTDEQTAEKSSVDVQSNGQSQCSEDTLNGFSKSADPHSAASYNNLNGVEMNNLNYQNISNGYSGKHQENLSRNPPYVNRPSEDSIFRRIYSSSSSEDDEQCVYTYKGAEVGSDLPESFLYLGMNVSNGRERASVCSSPDMDYLEMDFDPGPSNEQDSDSDNTSLNQNVLSAEHIFEASQKVMNKFQIHQAHNFENGVAVTCDENANCYSKKVSLNVESNTAEKFSMTNDMLPSYDEVDHEKPCCSKTLNSAECSVNGQKNDVKQSNLQNEAHYNASTLDEDVCSSDSKSNSNFSFRKLSEDSDKEEITFIPNAFANEIFENRNGGFEATAFDISLLEANLDDMLNNYEDLLPVDPSYSISAIMNVLKLLRIPCFSSDREKLINLLQHKQIPENVTFVEYLYMRAVENANENDLRNFSSNVFETKLYSRFFSTYPKTNVNLLEWLNFWMKRGAVPVLTRNVQERGVLSTKNIVRNSWRHNVVYRIESPFVYLSNPNEKITECHLRSQLSQAPLIYVKRKSILKRWNSNVDLRTLMRANNNRWYNENVLGQIATIIREHYNGSKLTQYVRIPSSCNCGITIFVPSENSALCNELDEALELPSLCF